MKNFQTIVEQGGDSFRFAREEVGAGDNNQFHSQLVCKAQYDVG
jgi:hypothetical protein